MSDIRQKITQTLADIAPSVEAAVVDAMVDREIDKRSSAIVQVMDKLQRAENDLRKIKPDLVSFDENRAPVSATWSKARLDERDKQVKFIEKLTNALNKALDKGDFGDVYNLATGKDVGGAADQGTSSGETD